MTEKTARLTPWVRRFAIFSAVIVVINVVLLVALANPKWAHPFDGGTDRLQIHATQPLPPEAADWARDVMTFLDNSQLPPGNGRFHLYVTGEGWRDRFFFFAAPSAGGVTYPVADKSNAFLSGADFTADRLYKHGQLVGPPRTLSYYGTHEVVHMIHVQKLGFLPYVRLPQWVREGVPDYIALGPVSAEELAAIRAFPEGTPRTQIMAGHGSYFEYRVMVTRFLETRSFEDLIWGRF